MLPSRAMTTKAFDPDAAAAADAGVFGLPHALDDARVIVLPVPYAATTSYACRAHHGPAAIFEASKQVDLHDRETGRPYEAGIAWDTEMERVLALHEEARPIAEKILAEGGTTPDDPRARRVNELSGRVDRDVQDRTREWLGMDRLVALVGGDHSTPYGAIAAHVEKHPGMGILHVDAHADLRVAFEGFTRSHASIMYNVTSTLAIEKLVQVGIRDFGEQEAAMIAASRGHIVTFFDGELAGLRARGETWDAQVQRIVAALPPLVYVSFDIDGLDPALCPRTGTPVPGGLSWNDATHLLGSVVRSGRRIVGCDVNEVAGGGDDDWDANVGARLLYKLIGWMVASNPTAR